MQSDDFGKATEIMDELPINGRVRVTFYDNLHRRGPLVEPIEGVVIGDKEGHSTQRRRDRIFVESDDGRRLEIMFSGTVYDHDNGSQPEVGYGARFEVIGA